MSAHSFATRAVSDARAHPSVNAPAVLPIYQSAGWIFSNLDEVDAVYEGRTAGTIYGGSGVPNHEALEALISSLHGAQATLVTTAGMASFTALLLHLAGSGTRIVAAQDLYGNTTRLLSDFHKFGVAVDQVDASNLDEVRDALNTPATLLVVETISNPRIRVADLRALSAAAHERGALVAVDNTLASPYHCRPLAHGADLVIESLTKFLGGHHDLVLGSVSGDSAIIDPMRLLASRAGLISAVLETWLSTRSIGTLDVRLARSSASALEIAGWLGRHAKVKATHYPANAAGTPNPVASRTLSNGFGSVLSFEVQPDRAAVNRLLAALDHIKLVLSFGGIATTLSHPATSSHRSLTPQARAALGIHDGFLRLSVGVEAAADIIADLERGLAAV